MWPSPSASALELPADTDLDMLLCAVYQRAFIADRDEGGTPGDTPFRPVQSPFAEVSPPASLSLVEAS